MKRFGDNIYNRNMDLGTKRGGESRFRRREMSSKGGKRSFRFQVVTIPTPFCHISFSSFQDMKAVRSFEPHLVISEITLPRSAEWAPQLPGWSFIQVRSRISYWWQPSGAVELPPGSVLVITGEIQGGFRASRLSDVSMAYFSMDLEKLWGLLSLSDQNSLKQTVGREH